MLATAWRLGITYPQSIKWLGHFLTADCKSAGTPNGGQRYPALGVDVLKYANNYIFPPKNFSISRTFRYFCSKKENMKILKFKDEKTYNEIEERMEALLAKGTQLGGMDFLSEVEKEELKVLSEAAYDWECEVDPHPWRVKPSLIAAIKVAFRQKGYKQKEAAKAIGVSTTALSDILHGRRAINFDVARNIYHNLGVPANVVLA